MKPLFFSSSQAFRNWLIENHSSKNELFVGFYKKSSGKLTMTWSESVDQAICFGWIDGVRKSLDAESYMIRFTPRKPASNWSKVNIEKYDKLKEAGLLYAAGIQAFQKRKIKKTGVYSYENKPQKLSTELEEVFKANEKGWAFFTTQASSYQKTIFYWIMSAKKEKTQRSRLEKVIRASEKLERLK